MEIPKEELDLISQGIEKCIESYIREQYLSDDDIIEITNELYDNEKTIICLTNIHEIRTILNKSDKPWAYHYSLNLNWVVFFPRFYRRIWKYLSIEERNEFKPIVSKVRKLRKILDHFEGIIEDGDIVYLIKTDVDFIKPKIQRWTI